MEPTTVAVCTLNQWALDFSGNLERILESIKEAKLKHGAKIRLGSELEICGYSCEDHFIEPETMLHSWEVLSELLKFTSQHPYNDMLCQFGMAVNCRGVIYNCGVYAFNGQLILIKPKLVLADDGNYRESRWFTPWVGGPQVIDFTLPPNIAKITGQKSVLFGNAMVRSEEGYLLGSECCEEMWAPLQSSTSLFLQGAHIVMNMSGSHFHLRKLDRREDLIKSATLKTGGVYLYSNNRGCDGSRLYFDGASMIAMNGKVLAVASQFSTKEVGVTSATVDLNELECFRAPANSRALQAIESVQSGFPIISIPKFELLTRNPKALTMPILDRVMPSVDEQIAYASGCWLWDYLRRSRANGFVLPLSGGADSASSLTIIAVMCEMVCQSLQSEEGYNLECLKEEVSRIAGKLPSSSKELMFEIMNTVYLGTENSSEDTKQKAKLLAEETGSRHFEINMDSVIKSCISNFIKVTKCPNPKFKSQGGTYTEDLALQNIQARSRMVMTYFLGQMLPSLTGKKGQYLVVGSGNLEEGLTGYMTKYDCSSADLNPIGGISKIDLKNFLMWASENKGFSALEKIALAAPTAELQPLGLSKTFTQTDEEEIGLTYIEMSTLGRMRKTQNLGPLYTFKKLCSYWKHLSKKQIAEKVKNFYRRYARNRHKMTVITPSVHIENYSADDNRYDMRPILYRTSWDCQFQEIDRLAN